MAAGCRLPLDDATRARQAADSASGAADIARWTPPASLRTGARIFLDCQSVDSIARDSGPFMTPAARWIANPAEAAGAWAADASPTSLRSLARAIWRLQGAERRVPLRVGPAVRAAIDRHDGIGTTDVRGRRATPVSVGSARHRKARVRCGSMDGKARWPGHCHARISSETAGRCAPKLSKRSPPGNSSRSPCRARRSLEKYGNRIENHDANFTSISCKTAIS